MRQKNRYKTKLRYKKTKKYKILTLLIKIIQNTQIKIF
jgi:hypothetical protein